MVWVFVAVFIFGVFFWSLTILQQQKKAWAAFAKQAGLQCLSGSWLKSSLVRGPYRGLPLNIYSEQQETSDRRGRKFRSVIQFELPGKMPVEGIVTTQEGQNFANGLVDLTDVVVPDYPGWESTVLIKTRDANLLKPYLTPERYRALQALMTIKNFSCIFIFDLTMTFLRFETPDPLTDAQKLDRLCGKIVEQAKVLIPS